MSRNVAERSAEELARRRFREAKRIVVKVGTRVLVEDSGQPQTHRLRLLVSSLAELHQSGKEIVLVTSGAIGSGMHALGLKHRPKVLADLQMAAAVGQSVLMGRYQRLFTQRKISVGQVLLTYADLSDVKRQRNAKHAMGSMFREGVIPIVNENDVVAVDEIKFGDNDILAALVTKLLRAEALVLLSSTDGLLAPDARKQMRRVPFVPSVSEKVLRLAFQNRNELSVGGMRSKLLSAQTAGRAGAVVAIIDGRKPGELRRLIQGAEVGTVILSQKRRAK